MNDHLLLRRLAKIVIEADSRRGGYGGQGITEWSCAVCGTSRAHSSTATPLLCGDCRANLDEICSASQTTERET